MAQLQGYAIGGGLDMDAEQEEEPEKEEETKEEVVKEEI